MRYTAAELLSSSSLCGKLPLFYLSFSQGSYKDLLSLWLVVTSLSIDYRRADCNPARSCPSYFLRWTGSFTEPPHTADHRCAAAASRIVAGPARRVGLLPITTTRIVGSRAPVV